jgi:putative FmdB family regulatory protein
MPRFDFKCTKCNSVVELIVTAGETPDCSTCNQPMTKQYTPPAIHFKGGGWGGNHGQVR